MKWSALVSASALAVFAAQGAPAKAPVEKSPDVLRAQQLKRSAARTSAPLVLSAPAITAAATAVTDDDVGDADSFGRNVTYLGLAQTMSISVQDDCSASDP